MAETLTRLERRILDFIVEYLRRNTYQPSIREIGKRFDIRSTKTVSEYLQSLAEKGYIERDGSRSRAVRIVGLQLAAPTQSIPFFGRIAAGRPTEISTASPDDEFQFDPRLIPSPDAFLMRVSGDSMDGVGILDGDLVVVERGAEAVGDGDVVAARVDGEGTVKRYFRRGGAVVLEPSNPEHEPIVVQDFADFELLGRVIGLFRSFAPQPEPVGA